MVSILFIHEDQYNENIGSIMNNIFLLLWHALQREKTPQWACDTSLLKIKILLTVFLRVWVEYV